MLYVILCSNIGKQTYFCKAFSFLKRKVACAFRAISGLYFNYTFDSVRERERERERDQLYISEQVKGLEHVKIIVFLNVKRRKK